MIGICLDCFVEKGLTVTTTTDLCNANNLQNGGIYYYFDTKEEMVLACVEEAISRIEQGAFSIAFEDIKDIANAPRYLDGKRVQLLDIYYSGVGILHELTPEEMEEAFQHHLAERNKEKTA